MKKPRLNRALLLKVADYIERHPDKYDQSAWMGVPVKAGDRTLISMAGYDPKTAKEAVSCDTVGCVAGWAVFLTDRAQYRELFELEDDGYLSWLTAGRAALGLSEVASLWLFASYRKDDVEDMPATLRAIAAGAEPWADDELLHP